MTAEEFRKVELKVGEVLAAEMVAGSNKLMKMDVDIGEKDEAGNLLPRQIVAGIGKVYKPEEVTGRKIIVVANLEPREIMGLRSNGMLLAASDGNGDPVILAVERDVQPGAKIT
ncbi:MAG: methionine--tRNA ligase [Patescibacteria group bacterium]